MYAATTELDALYMARALRLAERGLYSTMPNPRVGCVLVRAGEVIGEGWHIRAGEGHAEVNALSDARARGFEVAGATAYITLEPCSHTGRTGPCAEALVRAGIERAVFAMEDPNPQVAGRGLQMLTEAGIEVAGPLLETSARKLNAGFIKRMEQGLPLVRLKSAISLDGRTAMASGESKWITGPAARADVQRLRARSCAVIAGVDTIIQDNAMYTVREQQLGLEPEQAALALEKQPLRVILDSRLRLPKSSQMLAMGGPILLVHAQGQDVAGDWPDKVELLSLPARDGRIDLRALLQELARRQCNEVLVESGATLSGAFLRRGLVDELITYMAPVLMGSNARPLFELPLDTMTARLDLKITDVTAVGRDWRITSVPDTEA